ncbi:MAG: hypothetical protein ACO31K_05955, partial [Schleiferiaceae bacterium]
MTSASRKRVAALWSALRYDFCLPREAVGSHVCQWEVFDFDMAGCKLCGRIHECGDGCVCMESDDAEVCVVTGSCRRSRQLAFEQEFCDNMTYAGAGGVDLRPDVCP